MFSDHPVINFIWIMMVGGVALGFVSWVYITIFDLWCHFKTDREIKKLMRDAEIEAKIEIIKKNAEEPAPQPWIY